MIPFVPILLGGAVLGGLAYAISKATGGQSGTAALDDLADRVTATMPRGERAFKPDIAAGILGAFASKFYTWPDPNERRVVSLAPNQKGTPISVDVSAMGWATSMNKNQSILAQLTMATTTPGVQLLRAVPPGTESQYAGKGGLYAVLLYAGTLAAQQAPPGSPPATVDPNVVPPTDALELARQELAPYPDLLNEFMNLLANGQDPDAMDAFANQLSGDGFVNAPALLHKRATDLRGGVPAFKPGVLPGPLPGPLPAPAPAPLPTPAPVPQGPLPGGIPGLPPPNVVPPGTAIVATQTDPLSVRSAPSASANIVGSLARGSIVQITGAIQNGFYPVTQGSVSGFAYGGYLRPSSAPGPAPGPSPGPLPPGTPPPNNVGVGYAVVTTSTDPLSVRSSPSTSAPVVGSFPKGAVVQITGPMQNGFYPAALGALHGFAYGGYLQQTGQPPSVPTPAPIPPGAVAPAGEGGGADTMHVTAPSGLNLRASAPSGQVLTTMPLGSTVTVIENDNSGWINVSYNGMTGYASAQYLS